MHQFNLLPWRATQQQRQQRWVLLIWLGWGVVGTLGWQIQVVVLQQQQAQLLPLVVSPQPPSSLDRAWVAWQREPLYSAHEGWLFWSLLAEITPAEMALQTVRWQPPAVELKGVIHQADALSLLLTRIAHQPMLMAPEWLNWVPDVGSGAQFELALEWAYEGPHQ